MDNETLQKMAEQFLETCAHLALRLVIALVITLIALRLIHLVVKIVRKSMTRVKADESVTGFVCSFLRVALTVLLAFGIAAAFGLNTASILALLGSAGVAIGLAVQGSLSNLAGGVMILALRPFRIGDYILEDSHGHEGTVREISLFTTKLTTYDNKIVVLPNGDLANTALTNLTGAVTRMLEVRIGVAYDTDIKTVKEVLRTVAMEHPAVLKDKPVDVFIDSFEDSAMIAGLRCFVPTRDFKKHLWLMNEQIKEAFDRAGIVIPFPQREVRMLS
ncbi:MAG: mechanosensitive ion channel family protein [Lachnospiraceae bacterium]|nr:mechanosensitive ion channel family protein [Lachnospiraceae bacterium]